MHRTTSETEGTRNEAITKANFIHIRLSFVRHFHYVYTAIKIMANATVSGLSAQYQSKICILTAFLELWNMLPEKEIK